MEKLIELLNDFIPEWWSIEHWGKSIFYEWVYYNDRIIWKDFWFIKWLVEKDKIDIEKEIKNSELNWLHEHYFREDCLLMLLAIQDEPIEFLISILK